MKEWLKRNKIETTLALVIVITLAVLVIVNNLPKPAPAPQATVGEILGSSSNRSATGTNATGASLTDSQISIYQDKVRSQPTNADAYANLGLAYLQKVREIADPSYYTKAEGVLKKSLELDPNNINAMGGLGSLALSRHQFADGLAWGQKAQKLRPALSYNYGVMTDAQIELGQYEAAAQTLQQMVDLHPDLSSYSRISYLRELHGNYDGAVEAMQEAITAGGPVGENRAWVTYQLGLLYFNRGDLAKAETTFQDAQTLLPNYVYAQAGLGKIAAAKGDLKSAIATFSQLSQRMPLVEFIIELGDLYTANNQADQANQQYNLVRSIQKLYADNGVDSDMEMALFDADHNNNLPAALDKARHALQIRPSIRAEDGLAWTLYQSGNYTEAQTHMQQALRLNTQDALFYFHAGMIAAKTNQPDQARDYLNKALTINPNFSLLYGPVARQTLTQLGGPAVAK